MGGRICEPDEHPEAEEESDTGEQVSAKMVPDHEFQRRLQGREEHGGWKRKRGRPHGEEQTEEEQGHQRVKGEVRNIPPYVVVRKEAIADGEPGEQERAERHIVALPEAPRGRVVVVAKPVQERRTTVELCEVPELVGREHAVQRRLVDGPRDEDEDQRRPSRVERRLEQCTPDGPQRQWQRSRHSPDSC